MLDLDSKVTRMFQSLFFWMWFSENHKDINHYRIEEVSILVLLDVVL